MATSTRSRIGAFGALFIAVILPFVLESPAQASTFRDKCTVTPQAPAFENKFTSRGKKIVNYPIHVQCDGGRDIEIRQQFLERDIFNGAPVYSTEGQTVASHSRTALWGWWLDETIRSERTLPYADTNGDDEVLHKVQFRVKSGGVTGNWTAWESSPVRSIQH